MATINYYISFKKSDKTYNVKYELIHNRVKRYFSSTVFLNDSQIRKKKTDTKVGVEYSIRDQIVLRKVEKELLMFRSRIEDLGHSIKLMDIDDVKNHVTSIEISDKIDFVAFCKEYLEELNHNGKIGTLRSMKSPFNHLADFVEKIDANEVDSSFLKAFEMYLRNDKIISRNNSDKAAHKIKSSLGDSGVFKVMQAIRTFHNKCKEKYNTERNMIIKSDPFNFYKMPKYKIERKDMDKSLVDKIREYRDLELTGRKEQARDLFMLSFYLCGMNAKDLYKGEYEINDGRVEYNRSKTSDRRSDSAFVSIYIPEVAKPLLEKYSSEFLQNKYNSHEGLLQALTFGFKGTGFTFYDARHSFASIAVNICGFSFDKVERALNHFDETRVINRYAARDWSVIDDVQTTVLDLLKKI